MPRPDIRCHGYGRREIDEANVIGKECQRKIDYNQKLLSLLPESRFIEKEAKYTMLRYGMVRTGRAAIAGLHSDGLDLPTSCSRSATCSTLEFFSRPLYSV